VVLFTDKNNDDVQAGSNTGDHSDTIILAFFSVFSVMIFIIGCIKWLYLLSLNTSDDRFILTG